MWRHIYVRSSKWNCLKQFMSFKGELFYKQAEDSTRPTCVNEVEEMLTIKDTPHEVHQKSHH